MKNPQEGIALLGVKNAFCFPTNHENRRLIQQAHLAGNLRV